MFTVEIILFTVIIYILAVHTLDNQRPYSRNGSHRHPLYPSFTMAPHAYIIIVIMIAITAALYFAVNFQLRAIKNTGRDAERTPTPPLNLNTSL